MARQEQYREDLLREATALAERAELQLPDYVVEFPRFHGGGRCDNPFTFWSRNDVCEETESNVYERVLV